MIGSDSSGGEDDVEFREMGPADVPAALALRNTVFADAPLGAEDWARDDITVSIALRGGEVIGAIPLAPRELRLGPGLAIRAPFENAVGTREDWRSRGVGSGMIAAARDFMRGRADGLFVYRGNERSAGYRFYVKSGHHDLLYTHAYTLERPPPTGPAAAIVPLDADTVERYTGRLLPLFRSSYGAYAGYPRRHPGYWRRALASSIFAALPMDRYLVSLGDPERMQGYAIVGTRTGGRADPALQVLELATAGADQAVAERLLRSITGLAAERGVAVTVKLAPDDPFIPAVLTAGFSAAGRGTVVMCQLLDCAEFFARYRATGMHMDGVGLRVWTPEQEHLLVAPDAGMPTLTLEMKDATLQRWLLGRVDLAARLREGSVTTHGAGPVARRAAAAAIPYQPWAYHQLDWI